jgi:carbonic anhydrase
MLKSLTLLALFGHVSHAKVVNYMQLGDDWPTDTSYTDNMCAGEYQSPINLRSDFEEVKFEDDKFFKHYEDLETSSVFTYQTNWLADKFTAQVGFAPAVEDSILKWKPNYFTSEYMNLTETFKVAQFHFHALSEHTIDGVRFDLEMHSVHLPDATQDGYFAGVQGLIFDTHRYDQSITKPEIAIIDKFFDSLGWD